MQTDIQTCLPAIVAKAALVPCGRDLKPFLHSIQKLLL